MCKIISIEFVILLFFLFDIISIQKVTDSIQKVSSLIENTKEKFHMENYIEYKKKIYSTILEIVENPDENTTDLNNEYFQMLTKYLTSQEKAGNREVIDEFLQIINNISEQHHRDCNFINKIQQILKHYQKQIKQTMSNIDIFHIFENNKLITHFLLKCDIITISDEIFIEMMNKIERNGMRYCFFFYPELEKFAGEERMKDVKNELLTIDPEFFEKNDEKRQKGENDSYICSLIQEDSVVEFISYVNRNNISLLSQISTSIFETNPFLIANKNTSLIEYSAFFGSIQIFQYLMMNGVDLKSSLWLYSIHSKNAELIHLIESNKVAPPKFVNESVIEEENEDNSNDDYIECMVESIKCHHNDIADYIEKNLLIQNNSTQEEKIVSYSIKYHNYEYFQNDIIFKYGLFYLCFYNYYKLVDFLIKKKESEIESKLI